MSCVVPGGIQRAAAAGGDGGKREAMGAGGGLSVLFVNWREHPDFIVNI